MARIQTHRDLAVWRNAMDAAMRVFEVTKTFPPEEKYSLVDQFRRCTRSVAGNLAEAWRKRVYRAAFLSKLNDAVAEATEAQTWVEIAKRCGYITASVAGELDQAYERIICQLITMSKQPEKWTSPP